MKCARTLLVLDIFSVLKNIKIETLATMSTTSVHYQYVYSMCFQSYCYCFLGYHSILQMAHGLYFSTECHTNREEYHGYFNIIIQVTLRKNKLINCSQCRNSCSLVIARSCRRPMPRTLSTQHTQSRNQYHCYLNASIK